MRRRSARKRNPPGLRRFSFLCYLPANGFRKRRSKRPAQGVVVNREERMKQATLIAASAVFALSAASMATASTLDDVKGKGVITCGVNGVLPGFSTTEDKGTGAGVAVDSYRTRAPAPLRHQPGRWA